MGMAASQARFLGLTARKNNVEYEGQQINQQRTVLSNETANYYNDLLGMSVPVPPSAADYTKTVYSFQDGALTNSISSMIAQPNGEYLISYTSNWIDDFAAVSAATSIVTKIPNTTKIEYAKVAINEGFTREGTAPNYVYKYKNHTLSNTVSGSELPEKVQTLVNTVNDFYVYEEDGTTYYFYKGEVEDSSRYNEDGTQKPTVSVNGAEAVTHYDYQVGAKQFRVLGSALDKQDPLRNSDEYYKTLSDDQVTKLIAEEQEYIGILNKQYGSDSQWMVRYVHNTSSNTWEPVFTKLNSVKNAIYDDNNTSLSYIPMYKVGSAKKNEEVKNIKARFEQDATGRIINVTLRPGEDDEVTYAVTTSTVTDQAKYDDAMNQYEYDKAKYDQAIQETNAKIEIIQAEDKNLELRLKQLDTEQDAIQTEMDAVQKVIEKNTESTFKTFG